MLNRNTYKSQLWHTLNQKLKDVSVTRTPQVDCGVVLKSAHLQHQTKAFSSAAELLLLFLSFSSTSFFSSLRSEIWDLRWDGGNFQRVYFSGGFSLGRNLIYSKQKSHIPVQGQLLTGDLGRRGDLERSGFLAIILLSQMREWTISQAFYSKIFQLSSVIFLQEGSLLMRRFSSDRKISRWENTLSVSDLPYFAM